MAEVQLVDVTRCPRGAAEPVVAEVRLVDVTCWLGRSVQEAARG